MKLPDLFRNLAILSGLAGFVLMMAGIVGFLIERELFGVRYFYNWFYIANSFLFLGIFLMLVYMTCPRKEKEE